MLVLTAMRQMGMERGVGKCDFLPKLNCFHFSKESWVHKLWYCDSRTKDGFDVCCYSHVGGAQSTGISLILFSIQGDKIQYVEYI